MRKALMVAVGTMLVGLAACEDPNDPNSGGTPVNLTWADCTGTSSPTWFAVQDGDGSWNRVSPVGNTFSFTISSGRGGIATYSPDQGLVISYLSTDEMQATLPNCLGSLRSVGGTVTGYSSLDNVNLQMDAVSSITFGNVQPAPSSFVLDGVSPASSSLIATSFQTTAGSTTFENYPTGVVVKRGITGSSGGTVDFGSPIEGITPVLRNVSIGNVLLGETINLRAGLWSSTTDGEISDYQDASGNVSGTVIAPYWGVSSSKLVSGETQNLKVISMKTVGQTTDSRFLSVLYTDMTDRSVTLGASISGITFAGGTRPSVTYTIQTSYDNLWDLTIDQGSFIGTSTTIEVLKTKAYLNSSSPSVTLEVPNLSGVSGFQAGWGLTSGTTATWQFLATGADLGFLSGPVAYTGAARSSTFTP